ncbi:tetratricopeptide repeat protein [Lachnospiraceae bacterium LCP25S3_G4]
MGSLILCHSKKAKQPYEITRIHRKIYTLEELCFYLCNNLYLVDYTIMNEQFCSWIEEELELEELAADLRESMNNQHSVEHFVLQILTDSSIYSPVEMNHIRDVLGRLKNQKDIEKRKYKADNLLENGEIEEAIVAYQALLSEETDETVDRKFYGKLYGCVGTAYGRIFLYEEAMEMFDKAFQICSDPMMLRSYIYAAFRALPKAEYEMFLSKSEIFVEIDEELQQTIQKKEDIIEEMVSPSEELLESWKKQYRRSRS